MAADRWISPLRYPGGKARMAPFLAELFWTQYGPMDIEIWAEPFAGGAGAGLTLLAEHQVPELWLMELNPALAAFWRSVVNDGDELADRVERTSPDMLAWEEARSTVRAGMAGEPFTDLDLGMAAFIVNRCSRSGIVNDRVGPIGGKHQTGRWKVGARFNPAELAERIRRIAKLAITSRVLVHEGDALDWILELNESGIGDELMLFVDPPYIAEGSRLYAAGMGLDDHRRLAGALIECRTPWLLTYDAHHMVPELYPEHRILAFEIPHTANRQRVDIEYAVLSDNLNAGDELAPLPRGRSWWLPTPAAADAA